MAKNFYKINFEREVVLQDKSTTFLSINRQDEGSDAIPANRDLIVVVYPQPGTFNTYADVTLRLVSTAVLATEHKLRINGYTEEKSDKPTFNRLEKGLIIENWYEFDTSGNLLSNAAAPPLRIKSYDRGSNTLTIESQNGTTFLPPQNISVVAKIGKYDSSDFFNWKLNGTNLQELNNTLSPPPTGWGQYFISEDTSFPNPFDGSQSTPFPLTDYGYYTGYVGRANFTWIRIPYDDKNKNTNGVTFRVDYNGEQNSHLKLNFYIVGIDAGSVQVSQLYPSLSANYGEFGVKDPDPNATQIPDYFDYQEVHLFGYTQDYVKTTRDNTPINLPVSSPIYDDNVSYGLLKTNPKISGNVKLTVDSSGSLSLNSFNANDELSDSSYKKFAVSPNSTYQKDVYEFFKKGTTPSEIIFDVYQIDTQYLNTKRTYDQQFDNFYNYGAEQLKSKFYDENFSFLAPIWLRKEVPDYFVIFRVDGPINPNSYLQNNTEENFETYFKNARIVKTYDMRDSSKLGSYIRKIVNDNRFKERPLEVSWENDIATYWYGISYQNGTLTSKGEFLYDYYKKDRPIKEFEEYITSGFQRNGIISSNLINLEFLFDDDEAPLYGINRYFGLYVKENQLAEFEIEPSVLGKIYDQTPAPKSGVDGQPYSTREFIQTNPNGIQIPVHYYHNTSYENNTSIVPTYVGYVDGKFPLPSMVDDPLRLFYVKDRNDVFKRINKLTEVDYGRPNTDDYVRATQLQVFDNQENMSVYGGVTNIVSQFDSELLGSGNSQLKIVLSDNRGTGTIADNENLVLEVKRYNDQDDKTHTYYLQVTESTLGSSLTVQYFIDQDVEPIGGSFVQPQVGHTAPVFVNDGTKYKEGDTVYLIGGGYYKVLGVTINPGLDQLQLLNVGGGANATPLTTIPANSLLGRHLSGSVKYLSGATTLLSVDNYLTLDLTDFNTGYSLQDSWRIDVNYPSIEKFKITGSRNVDVRYRGNFEKFRWVLNANPIGLQPGDAWDYPQFTPNTNEYVSCFSNEGTPTQIAQAIVKCVNSFENSPVLACAVGNTIYMSSKIDYEDGNSILFTRELTEKSYYSNLGFYVEGNALATPIINQKAYSGLSLINLSPTFVEKLDTPLNRGYYFKIKNTGTSKIIQGNIECKFSSLAAASTSGNSYWKVITDDLLSDELLPFTLNLSNIPANNTFYEFIYEIDSNSNVSQFFIGGVKRKRNRARVNTADASNYYDNRKVTRTASLTLGSNKIYVDTADLYISATVSGSGIPAGSKIIDVNSNHIIINNNVTLTNAASVIEIGEISPLNRKPILQQWYQAQKGLYSRMKSWDVQGLLLYTLPNLETPIYDDNGNLVKFDNAETYSILQLENPVQEFYISNDERIVAWNVYRPLFGVFSIYPIKQFDFDFIFSDYSYSPITEALTYYKEYDLKPNESVELAVFENYEFTVNTVLQGQIFNILIEAFNNNKWHTIDTYSLNSPLPLQITDKTVRFLFNTFYPIYVYDKNEFPFLSPYGNKISSYSFYTHTTEFQNKTTGLRNFNKRYLRTFNEETGELEIFKPTKFKITFLTNAFPGGTATLNIKNYNYSNDKDLELFSGFAGLQDILNTEDIAKIESLKNSGDYVSAYSYQLLLSEYDRLRENFNKDFAVSSIVVPYINKWVQEGTDARDNYYRLNNSTAFGISNISPSSQIDFADSSLFTQEFPYLDTTPKDFYIPGLSTSRPYMFARLNDIAYNGKTWYELLTSNDDNDWFLKYFTVGYPTEIDPEGELIKKPREERYTFLKYNEGVGKNQTIFRGAKIQGISINNSNPLSLQEIEDSKELDGYKFAAVSQFLKHDLTYDIESPFKFEVIKNEKYKTLLIIITVYLDDYRMQHGHYDYMSQYFMSDLLKTSNTNQLKIYPTISPSQVFSSYSFLPYDGTYTFQNSSNILLKSLVMRPRQGFLGGGYIDLNNKKLTNTMNFSRFDQQDYNLNTGQFNNVYFKDNFIYFPSLLDELNTTQNSYRITDNVVYPYIYNGNIINASQQANDGFFYGFSTLSALQIGGILSIRSFFDNQTQEPAIQPYDIKFGTAKRQVRTSVVDTIALKYPLTNTGTEENPINTQVYAGTDGGNEKETFSIEGGSKGYVSIQNFISFGNIQSLINNNSSAINYYNVINNVKLPATDYRLKFVSPDEIIKNNVLHYTEDNDKPQEYLDKDLIGFNLVDTNQNEYLVRHRGFYEPKTRDVLSFWVREDNEMSNHFQKDFLLNNTHISSNTVYSGVLKNYGFNKIAAGGEVLKIARASAYKSVYPLIGEVSVTQGDMNLLDSSWDANYYRNYSTTTEYVSINGISEMKEIKSFLASKTMNVPRTHEMHTFNSAEVQYNLQSMSTPLGVSQLVTNSQNASQNMPDANKPVLTINVDVKTRLLRQLIEDINNGNVDEFNKLPGYLPNVTALSSLTPAQIDALKTSYLEKNIIELYEVTDIFLYSLNKQGIELVNLNLTEQEKTLAGYKINKNCKVIKNTDFTYTITIVLDTKDPVGFALSTNVKRI